MTRIRHIDGPSPLEFLLAEIEHLPGCSVTKARVMRLLRQHAGLYLARRDLVLRYRQQVARELLASGMQPRDVRRRLRQLFGISADTAERIVTGCLSAARPPQETSCET